MGSDGVAADSSWGDASWGNAAGAVPRTPGGLTSRDADRARRAEERVAAAQARSDDRVTQREAAMREREQAREARRIEEDARRAAADAGNPDFVKRRASGAKARTGIVEKVRDTRHYQTIVDVGRMRELAKRGASVAGLAGAFGISVEEVEEALAEG